MPTGCRMLACFSLLLIVSSRATAGEVEDTPPPDENNPTRTDDPGDANDPAATYARRFAALAADDDAGHYKLAEWCLERRRFDLLAQQCRHILERKPDHANATLLLEVAAQELAKAGARRRSGRRAPADRAGASDRRARLISNVDIQELRFAELHHRRPERVHVKFSNDACDRFAESMMRDGTFSRADRVTFLRLKPAHRLALIVERTGDVYKNDIEIRSDPVIFRVFRRRVLPTVMNGCGSAQCHGGVKAPVFRLYSDAALTEASDYTNFMILDGLQARGRPLIDRDQPGESLLLHYLLPRDLARDHHVPEIDPIVRDGRDEKYRVIAQWIAQLRFPHFGYDVSWRPARSPESTVPGP